MPLGAAYDDVWAGGFEELFPNDAPGVFDGHVLADHGELWNATLEIVGRQAQRVGFRHACVTVPAVVEKAIILDPAGTGIVLRYSLHNAGRTALRYLFKLHSAMRVEAGDRILLPGGTVSRVEAAVSGIVKGSESYRWPGVDGCDGASTDLALVRPPESALREFVYVSDLPAGWCGLLRSRTGERIRFAYPLEVFPYCWLFITYGGWRGHYTVVLEPCTNMPKDLGTACADGRCAELAAGASRTFEVYVTIDPANGV